MVSGSPVFTDSILISSLHSCTTSRSAADCARGVGVPGLGAVAGAMSDSVIVLSYHPAVSALGQPDPVGRILRIE